MSGERGLINNQTENGHTAAVKLLLENEANIHNKQRDGSTALTAPPFWDTLIQSNCSLKTERIKTSKNLMG